MIPALHIHRFTMPSFHTFRNVVEVVGIIPRTLGATGDVLLLSFWNDNTAASCAWQMDLFQVGVGLKEVIWRYWPTAWTLQHLGKVKQFSWIWLGSAVQLECCRRGISAFCRVVEPRLQFSSCIPARFSFHSLSARCVYKIKKSQYPILPQRRTACLFCHVHVPI